VNIEGFKLGCPTEMGQCWLALKNNRKLNLPFLLALPCVI